MEHDEILADLKQTKKNTTLNIFCNIFMLFHITVILPSFPTDRSGQTV